MMWFDFQLSAVNGLYLIWFFFLFYISMNNINKGFDPPPNVNYKLQKSIMSILTGRSTGPLALMFYLLWAI